MKKMIKISLFLVCIVQMLPAWAERAYPIITFTCDQQGDVLKIKNEIKWGEAGKNFVFSAKKGTYNPWDWVQLVDRRGRKLVSQSKSVKLSCELSGHLYHVILEPKLFNPDFNGKCGDKLSAKVSIFTEQESLLESKELEQYCMGNAKVIRGIKVYGKKQQVKLFEIPRHKLY